MANVLQHNQLLKVCFDGSKHLNHVMTSDEIKKLTVIEGRYPLSRMPVCGSCEKIAYWNKNKTAYCPSCGTYTRVPVTYATYLASGYDIDATGITARHVLQQEKEKRQVWLPDFKE